jgi:hypothetical protein
VVRGGLLREPERAAALVRLLTVPRSPHEAFAMIISHSRKFIFIKTLKTGGTSLEMALSKYCAPGDVLTPIEEEAERRNIAGIGAQNYLTPASSYGLKKRLKMSLLRKPEWRFGEHTPAWLVRERAGQDVWDEYFTFTIVRDPVDRCVSRYYYTKKYFKDHGTSEVWDWSSFDQFLRYHPELINENWPMYTVKDQIIVDFAVRYEHMEADLAEVSRRIGLPGNLHDDMRSIRAKAGYRPKGVRPRDVVNETQLGLIETLCRQEIDAFGYQPRAGGNRAPEQLRALVRA